MNAKSYKFSPYLLEVDKKKLHRDGQIVPMTPKRFEILLLLIERAGQVVRKEEIMQRVWPGQEVEESNLTQHIFFLRRTLGDDPRTPNYIMTIPGAGYLFYQPVQVVHEDGSEETIGGFQAHQSVNLLGEQTGLAGSGLEQEPRSSLFRNKRVAIIAAAAGLGVLFFAIWWSRNSSQVMPYQLPTVQPIVTMPGTKGDLSFSRDGQYLAFSSEGDTVDSQNLFVQSVDGTKVNRLTRNAYTDHRLTWSPDNRQIAFLRSGVLSNRKNKIIIIPASGGDEQEIGEAWHGLDWSPDGQYLAICDSEGPGKPTGIYRLAVTGQRREPISKPNQNENLFDSNPRYSPDGRSIAFTRWTSGANGDLYTIDLTTGELRQLTTDRVRISSLQWSSTGKEILFVSNRTGNYRIWSVSSSGGTPSPVEGPLGEVEHFTIFRTSSNENLLAYTQQFNDTN
ncbi:MAG: winged helix-turn-helix domain-containing protein, partial [Acidobacteriota bacterium]